MPANLTPQYLAAEARYREARTPEEKIEALQEMLREIPKHKGTEAMQGDIKRRLAQTKKELGKRSATARRTDEFHIAREGAGQVVLVGPPNAGKSALLDRITNARPEVADYPFTTRRPQPCMALFEDVQIQMVDTASISADFFEPWLVPLVRNADLVTIVLDLSSDELLDDFETVVSRLEASKLRLLAAPTERFGPEGIAYKKTHLVAGKADAPRASENLDLLRELVGGRFEIFPLSVKTGEGIEPWLRRVFELLEVIRIYAKQPGKPASTDPVLLRAGSTVLDFARTIHKDFAEKLKYARLWGHGKFEGQMVHRDYVLADRDTIELHL